MKTYSKNSFRKHCDAVRSKHKVIEKLHLQYGYPPYWKRENGFESLCKTIIEQQVSLASAQSSFERLKIFCGSINPMKLSSITIEEYRSCGITKQKASYLTLLSQRLLTEPDFFISLEKMKNQTAKEKLISLKGIGHWTANVYMLIALNRIDIYPDFDVALIKSIAHEIFDGNKMDNETAKEFIAQFSPLQSIACLYFYHAYIVRKGVRFVP